MKLLKIFGIVAGLHAFALLLIFANPGCSSSRAVQAPDAAPAPPPEPTPTISAVTAVPPADAVPAVAPAPADASVSAVTPVPDAAPAAGAFYSPTRPGTAAAAALENQPAVDVTPATTYSVGKGDSLWSIAKKNHLRVSVLAAANHLRVGTALRPGQKLLIPGKSTESKAAAASAPAAPSATAHAAGSPGAPGDSIKVTVHRGETLGTIAQRYHVRVGALALANSISDPQKIRPGQELIIPGRSAAGKSNGAAAAKGVSTAPAPAAESTQIPAANQDLDAGLKNPPANPVPIIRIDPDAPAPAPAAPPKQ